MYKTHKFIIIIVHNIKNNAYIYCILTDSSTDVNNNYSEPICAHEGDTYVSTVTKRYFGPSVMRSVIKWTTPGVTILSYATSFNSSSSTSGSTGTMHTSQITIPAVPFIPPTFIYTVYFESPRSVVVPGTTQATNAPDYNVSHPMAIRPTLFLREYHPSLLTVFNTESSKCVNFG